MIKMCYLYHDSAQMWWQNSEEKESRYPIRSNFSALFVSLDVLAYAVYSNIESTKPKEGA